MLLLNVMDYLVCSKDGQEGKLCRQEEVGGRKTHLSYSLGLRLKTPLLCETG